MKLNLSVSQKLILGFSVITIVVLMSYVSIFFSFQKSKKMTQDNKEIFTPSVAYLNELYILTNNSKLLAKNWVFIERHNDTHDKLKLKNLHKVDYPRVSKELERLSQYWTADQQKVFKKIQKTIKDTLFVQHQNIMEQLSSFESYEDPMIIFEINPLVEENGDIILATAKILKDLESIISEITITSEIKNKQMIEAFNRFTVFLLLISLVIIAGSVAASYITVAAINKPLNKLKANLLKKSKGDFSYEFIKGSSDEIGEMIEAVDLMSKNIRQAINGIRSGADKLLVSSIEISNSSRNIAQGANEQAASTEEVSASMEQMNASISMNTENSIKTKEISNQVATNISIVNKSVEKSTDAMKDIAEKTLIINEIAERIDMLAINAAIEAARAGEYGKGFAVVANEIRKLAENTQLAAAEINKASKNTVKVAEHSNTLLKNIIPEIEKTVTLIQEITSASIEQNSGIHQVSNAVSQLSNVTQQNSAASEELATGSEELKNQAQILFKNISFFKTSKENEEKEVTIDTEEQNYENEEKEKIDDYGTSKGVFLNLGNESDNDFESF